MIENTAVRSSVAFAELFQHNVDAVFAAAYLVVRDRYAAAEITEQTFIEGWAAFNRTHPDLFDQWLLARARDRAFTWNLVQGPGRLDPTWVEPTPVDGPDSASGPMPAEAALDARLRARIVRALWRAHVPIRGELMPGPPASPPVADAAAGVALEPVAPPPPPPAFEGFPDLDQPPPPRTEHWVSRWPRLTGVTVGLIVGLVATVAIRTSGEPTEESASPAGAVTDLPHDHDAGEHDHATTTSPPITRPTTTAPPTTAPPRRHRSARTAPSTTAPPPTAPPTTAPRPATIQSFTATFADNQMCRTAPPGDMNTFMDRNLIMTWQTSGATSARLRTEGGPWVPVPLSSGYYEVCGQPGVPWYLEVSNPTGATTSTATPPSPFTPSIPTQSCPWCTPPT